MFLDNNPATARGRRLGVMVASALLLALCACTTPHRIEDYGRIDARQTPAITGAQGQLPSRTSQVIMNRLQGEVEPGDFLQRHSLLIEKMSGSPLVTGNQATLLIDGPDTFQAMLKAIRAARTTIHFESYIFEDDEVGRSFAAALLARQAEGVQVRLLYDSVGCMSTPAAFFQRLRDGGIQVREFNPVNPARLRGWRWRLKQRDHRKILVVDGAVAFTGGVNISAIYSSLINRKRDRERRVGAPQHAWRDTDIRIEGPVVAEFEKLFLDSWARQGGPEPAPAPPLPPEKAGTDLVQVIGSTPGRDHRFTYMMYVAAFSYAESSIHLTTPYFVPDEQILKALCGAAERGLDVKIILPGSSDSQVLASTGRSYYTFLMKAGVRLFERKHGAMMHAKTAVVDQVWSTVGSSNMDSLSFLSNDEVNAAVLGSAFADRMEAMFQDDLAQSEEIRPGAWNRRPIKEWLKEWSARMVGSWL